MKNGVSSPFISETGPKLCPSPRDPFQIQTSPPVLAQSPLQARKPVALLPAHMVEDPKGQEETEGPATGGKESGVVQFYSQAPHGQ